MEQEESTTTAAAEPVAPAPVIEESAAPNALAATDASSSFSFADTANKAINWFKGMFDHGSEKKDEPAPAPAEDPAAKAAAEAKADDASARATLDGKVKVKDGDGPRAPNEVSQAEYDKLVTQYNDIKRGRGDLQFDTSNMKPDQAEAYKAAAMGDMSKMMQTESGRAMLDKLTNDTDADGHHIVTKLTNPEAANRAPGSPTTKPDDKSDGAGENGRTTGSTIYYTPGKDIRLQGQDVDGSSKMDLLETSDTILMHEMGHAYHYAKGDTASGAVNPVNPVDSGIDRSEYQASGLGTEFGKDKLTENAYRAERKRLGEDVEQRPRYSPNPTL